MRVFLMVMLTCLRFTPAEVYLRDLVLPPGGIAGEKELHCYEALRAGGTVMKAEIISVPVGGPDLFDGLEKGGKVVFRDSRTIGLKYQEKIILMKMVGRGRVLRLTLNADDLE